MASKAGMRLFCYPCLEFHAQAQQVEAQDAAVAQSLLQNYQEQNIVAQLLSEQAEHSTQKCKWCYKSCMFEIGNDVQVFGTLLAASQSCYQAPDGH